MMQLIEIGFYTILFFLFAMFLYILPLAFKRIKSFCIQSLKQKEHPTQLNLFDNAPY